MSKQILNYRKEIENNIFTPFPILTTGRLTLRQLSINDDKEIFAMRSDGKVNKYLERANATSIEDARRFIHKITDGINKNELIYWAITLKNNNKLIGTICFFSISKEKTEIGFELQLDYRGKGIMQEAVLKVIEYGFQNMRLSSIEAYTHPDNENSTKLLEKCNFRKQENPDSNTGKKFIILKLTNLTYEIHNRN